MPTTETDRASYDFIVPLPYTSNLVRSPEGGVEARLSVLSRMAIDAAGLAWQTNPQAKLVIAGEAAYDGLPSTTDLMALRAEYHCGVAPEALVMLHALGNGQKLNNTYLQMRALAEALGEPSGNVLFVPLGFHLPRVARIAKAFGFANAASIPAEAVLRDAGEHRYNVYAPFIPQLASFERWLGPLTALDRKGRLLTAITTLLGGRQMDIVVSEGRIVTENTSAQKKLRQLARASAPTLERATTTLEPAFARD
jgi:hypothetical protein